MDPQYVNDTLLATFSAWINFAMGTEKLGGRILKDPSGRYASAIKAQYDEDGYVVGIYLDKDELKGRGLPGIGHRRIRLKDKMLNSSKTKISKEGYSYRYVPISDAPSSPFGTFVLADHIKNLFTTRDAKTGEGGILSINRNLSKMWAANYRRAHKFSSKIRTMSNKPGAARWEIPAMASFSVARLLKQMTPTDLRGRIQV